MPSEPPICRRLDPSEVEAAIASLPLNLQTRQIACGFRILVEEPELYNKWLYTIPDANGNLRPLGLGRRFCPIFNRLYAGFSLYHPALNGIETLMALRRVVLEFLRLPQRGTQMEGLLRGLIEGIAHPPQRWSLEEHSVENSLQFQRMEDDVDENEIASERGRVSWNKRSGPVWRDESGASVEIDGLRTSETVYQLQHCLNYRPGYNLDPAQMRLGIRTLSECHERHGYLSIFSRGAFLIYRTSNAIDGCLWCYRSFNPRIAGWTIWLRRPYVSPERRRRGVFRSLARAAIGIFAEAGYPTQLRRLCSMDASPTPLLGRSPVRSTTDDFYQI